MVVEVIVVVMSGGDDCGKWSTGCCTGCDCGSVVVVVWLWW